MNKIQTRSFNLAIYAKGDVNSPKLALVLPGRFDSKDYLHMHSHVELLSKRGYYALSFDPPGTWESDGDVSIFNNTSYIKATNEIIEYYGSKPTLLVGHSRGATISMLAGCQNENVIGFISIMGGYAQRALSEAIRPDVPKYTFRDDPNDPAKEIKIEIPYSFFVDSAKYNALDGLSKCVKPKLFIYGEHDTTVKESSVMESFESAAQPKELASIESDHNYRQSPEKIDRMNEIISQFLDNYGL